MLLAVLYSGLFMGMIWETGLRCMQDMWLDVYVVLLGDSKLTMAIPY